MTDMFQRTEQLLGEDTLLRLQHTKVILFGVGGVGGWCAEALVRTGITHLTLVDFDIVAESNLNRQVVATADNIGQPKVNEMRKRLLAINPQADIIALNCRYSAETETDFCFDNYDYVIDAIDSVDSKALLLLKAAQSKATLFSSMGAGRKRSADPIRVTEFWKAKGCPLARALRERFRKTGQFPAKKFQVVYSEEISGTQGTLAHVVGTFGFRLAELLITDLSHAK